MAAFPRIIQSDRDRFADDMDDTGFETGFEPPERIGAPLLPRRSRVLRRAILLVGLGGAGWLTYADPTVWPRTWSTLQPVASALIEAMTNTSGPKLNAPTATNDAVATFGAAAPMGKVESASAPSPAPVAELAAGASVKPEALSGAALPVAVVPVPTIAIAPAPKQAARAAREPAGAAYAPPAKTMPADPMQQRAEAVGLHPELSRAVLQRLSEADFKAAATAIRRAFAGTGDDGVLIWPARSTAAAAQFRVSFVDGANPDCRRYVVAIAKDGWQTTALPMEKCGVRRAPPSKG